MWHNQALIIVSLIIGNLFEIYFTIINFVGCYPRTISHIKLTGFRTVDGIKELQFSFGMNFATFSVVYSAVH